MPVIVCHRKVDYDMTEKIYQEKRPKKLGHIKEANKKHYEFILLDRPWNGLA